VGFLNALVNSLEGQLCVDTSRIGVTGMSEGATMAYRMGCANLPWVAAIAPVAGTMFGIQMQCQMAHPTPLLAINGKKDPAVWYNGYYPGDSVPQVVANWAHAVGCPTTGTTGLSQGDVVETVYSPCTNGADTELYTVTDGGHTWPGGSPMPWLGVTSTTINASALIGTFIATHPLH
jgi:polyhydroxybutyrate depolymerase